MPPAPSFSNTISCEDVLRELVTYMDCELDPDLAVMVDLHLAACRRCTAVYDGARNVVALVRTTTAISPPRGFSQRLYRRLSVTLTK